MEFTTRFELHSQATRLWGKSRRSAAAALRAYHPLRAVAPVKVDLDGSAAPRGGSPKHHMPRDRRGRRFGDGLCPFHSPLLGASRLFSFPPLINMLKFGGSPCLLSGRKICWAGGRTRRLSPEALGRPASRAVRRLRSFGEPRSRLRAPGRPCGASAGGSVAKLGATSGPGKDSNSPFRTGRGPSARR